MLETAFNPILPPSTRMPEASDMAMVIGTPTFVTRPMAATGRAPRIMTKVMTGMPFLSIRKPKMKLKAAPSWNSAWVRAALAKPS